MTVESGKAAERRESKVPVLLLVILVMALAGGAGFWYLEQQSARLTTPKPVLTAEAKLYTRNLKLSEVEMKAADTYLRQTLVEIVGKITNAGGRRLQSVEINCVFYDPYGQVVLRERAAIVRGRTGGLNPGETKSFRLPFDNIPESWNQTLPQLVIAEIKFE
jgi:hypothetical protein